jgi:hypothetical protein
MTSLRRDQKKNEDGKVAAALVRTDLLRWLYLARITLVSGILLAALLRWQQALHLQTFVATSIRSFNLITLLVNIGSSPRRRSDWYHQ